MNDGSQPIKAVFFDIGGVVVKSPLIAIHNYEREKGLPKDWLNLHTTELELYPFYKAFGEELSDKARGNEYYREWCRSRNVEIPHLPESATIDGREVRTLYCLFLLCLYASLALWTNDALRRIRSVYRRRHT
ncbi:hypothetical protein FRC12_014776 [Ceratobasidium sp. 428]|nr:hypothetical protein FRC12_014776 [Ceratobasidium sp. 428]